MTRILSLHIKCKFIKELEIWLKLITTTDNAKRWMIAIVTNDIVELLIQELGSSRILVYLKRPVWQLNLTVESHLISHAESSLWGTPGVETQMIKSVLAGCGKHLHPTTLVCWRRSRQWEYAALQRASEESGVAVDEQAVALGLEATHAEGNGE